MRFFRRETAAAAAAPLSLRLLSRPGCHLCDAMKDVVEPIVRETGGSLVVVNVDMDPELRDRWGDEIPVLLDGEGRLVAKVRDPEAKIRRRLLSR